MKKKMVVAAMAAVMAMTSAAFAGSVWSTGALNTSAGVIGSGVAGSNGGFDSGGAGPGLNLDAGGNLNTLITSGRQGTGQVSAFVGSGGSASSNCYSVTASVGSNSNVSSSSSGNATTTGSASGSGSASAASFHHYVGGHAE